MNESIITLHEIKDRSVLLNPDADEDQLDLAAYSRFKYGDAAVARQYGVRLADKFLHNEPRFLGCRDAQMEFVALTSPSRCLPKGARAILSGFLGALNRRAWHAGRSPVPEIKIFKEEMFAGDYGTFTDEERRRLTEQDRLHAPDQYLKGKHVIVLDDVRVTGTHERNLAMFLWERFVVHAYFLYVAVVDEAFAQVDPQIESALNHGWVNSFARLSEIINSGAFIMNARVCKYVLSHDGDPGYRDFLRTQSSWFLQELLEGAIGDGYAYMTEYRTACTLVEQELNTRSGATL